MKILVAACGFMIGTGMLTACSLVDTYRSIKALGDVGKCRLEPGQRPLSNYELVKAADAIALASVRRVGRVPPQQVAGTALLDYRVELEIETVLKGVVEQQTLTYFGFEDRATRASEDDFTKPTRQGADPFSPPYPCGVPNAYRVGGRYLLFLVQMPENRQWTFPRIPMSRLNEEVDGEDAPWSQAVRQYIRIASLMDEQAEERALRELQARARRGADPWQYPPALVTDVERHFERKSSSGK